METPAKDRWYYRIDAVVIALLCVGPLALPLLFLSPKFNRQMKVLITLFVILLTVWLAVITKDALLLVMQRLEEVKALYGIR